MRNVGKMLKTAVAFGLVMLLLCSFAYPLALTGVSQLVYGKKANGSLVDQNGALTDDVREAVGSALCGQDFTRDCYFHGRVSAVGYNTDTAEEKESGTYTGPASGSFNYGNSNPALEARIRQDLEDFLASHPGVSAKEVPADLLTASGSGLDPHISPEAAQVQVDAVAWHAGLSTETVQQIVKNHTEHRFLGIFGEERVNVLLCNLDIARAMEQTP